MTDSTSETQEFQDGVAAGRVACAEDMSNGLIGEDRSKHAPDWYSGWFRGYMAYMDEQYSERAKDNGRADQGGSSDHSGNA